LNDRLIVTPRCDDRAVKHCSKCGEVKPLDQYYAAAGCRDGLRGDCKACFSARAKARYAEKSEDIKASVKRWQQENAEHLNAYRRKRNATRRQEIREGHLRRKFGITLADYDAMLSAQGGGCAICGRPPAEGKSLHVDHDHETGVVRGLLCFTCNGAIGMLSESEETIARALSYVSMSGADTELVTWAQVRAAQLVAAGAGEGGN
jgi:hypothetical protein